MRLPARYFKHIPPFLLVVNRLERGLPARQKYEERGQGGRAAAKAAFVVDTTFPTVTYRGREFTWLDQTHFIRIKRYGAHEIYVNQHCRNTGTTFAISVYNFLF